MSADKSFFLKITSAIVIDGAIAKVGEIVEVSEAEAKNFLTRGKAVLATEADGAPAQSLDDDEDKDSTEADGAPADLSRMNKAKLVELAESLGIEGAEESTKAQIIAAIESNQAE